MAGFIINPHRHYIPPCQTVGDFTFSVLNTYYQPQGHSSLLYGFFVEIQISSATQSSINLSTHFFVRATLGANITQSHITGVNVPLPYTFTRHFVNTGLGGTNGVCFTSATENLEIKIGTFCGNYTSSSTINWGTATNQTIDHQSAGYYCGGSTGNNFIVTDCTSGAQNYVDDQYSVGPSVGDFVDWTDSSGTYHCGEITSSGYSNPATGSISATYGSCTECNSYHGFGSGGGGGGSLFTATNCADSSTWTLQDDYSYAPAVGDFVGWYDSNYNYHCGEVTATGVSGDANGWIDYVGFNDCDDCNSYYGL